MNIGAVASVVGLVLDLALALAAFHWANRMQDTHHNASCWTNFAGTVALCLSPLGAITFINAIV